MRIRVAAAAGGAPVDLSRVNGILSLAAGASPVTLAPKAIPSADIDYSSGAATIFVPEDLNIPWTRMVWKITKLCIFATSKNLHLV